MCCGSSNEDVVNSTGKAETENRPTSRKPSISLTAENVDAKQDTNQADNHERRALSATVEVSKSEFNLEQEQEQENTEITENENTENN